MPAKIVKRQLTDPIDITPEMIEAGAVAFAEYDGRFESKEEAVLRIFRSMIAVKHEACSAESAVRE